MPHEKIIEKVQKILNLTSSSEPGEAAAALEMATKIMAEYNITMRDVERHQIAEAEIKSTQSVSVMKDWEGWLIHLVAKAFGCSMMWRPGNSKRKDYWGRFVLVGGKSNVQMAEYSGTVLLRKLIDERTKFSRTLHNHGWRRGKEMTAELDGFCKGWIRVVSAKVHAFANSDDLQKIIDDYVKEKVEGRKADADDRGSGRIGQFHGQEAARDVHLHRPMDEDQKRRISHEN